VKETRRRKPEKKYKKIKVSKVRV